MAIRTQQNLGHAKRANHLFWTSNVADSVINDREWDILWKYFFYFVL